MRRASVNTTSGVEHKALLTGELQTVNRGQSRAKPTKVGRCNDYRPVTEYGVYWYGIGSAL